VMLEITDARGKLVRRYTSTDPPDLTGDELAKQLIPSYWVRPHNALATTAGAHRWVWDLRGERPIANSYGYPISAAPHDTPRTPEGPRVLPGSYTVKLTANGKTLTAPLEVKLDPRLKLAPAALAQQNQLEQRLAELITQSSQLVMQAQTVSEQLGKLAPAQDALKGQVGDVLAKLTAVLSGPSGPPGRERPPALRGVNGSLVTLYRMIEVDAAPTAAQAADASKAEREFVQLTKTWDALKAGELAQLNTALTAAGLRAVRLELAPQPRPRDNDEE